MDCPLSQLSSSASTATNDRKQALPNDQASEALESEIAELWGHISAASYRFLELIAEFDRTEGWARHGVANCAQWLNLKCGIGPVAAREKVRVARSLELLPQVSDAFRHGQISFSKVRAITRVATPETEETLLNVALFGTATHVERLVRHYRRVEQTERAVETRIANEQLRNRYLHFIHSNDDSVAIYARLPAEIGALVEKAIEAAMSTDQHESLEDQRDPIGARRADSLQLLAERFLADQSESCPSSTDRYQVVVHIDQSVLHGETDPTDTAANGLSEIEDGHRIAVETARRLACDSTLIGIVEDGDGEPLNVGRKTRSLSPAMKRALKARDGGCRFPGCDRTRYTDGHHIRHWADGGETKLGNLITLCRFHHRLIHESGFGLVATDDGAFVFSRPDGQRITAGSGLDQKSVRAIASAAPVSGPEPGGQRVTQVRARKETGTETEHGKKCFRGNISQMNTARGIDIRPPPGWHGERMDYGLAIERMLWEKRVGMA